MDMTQHMSTSSAIRIAELVSELVSIVSFTASVSTPPPKFSSELRWRHSDEHKDITLFVLTKLMGATSTVHACVQLAASGHWFQVLVLARSVNEALLQIEWVFESFKAKRHISNEASKFSEEIAEHFKDFWSDADRPFDETRSRKTITIRQLSAVGGRQQSSESTITQHDALEGVFQAMRVQSDFVHTAYPTVMELFSEHGWVLAVKQPAPQMFDELHVAWLLRNCVQSAHKVCDFLVCCMRAAVGIAERLGDMNDGTSVLNAQIQCLLSKSGKLTNLLALIDTEFPSSGEERTFLKQSKAVAPNKG